MKTYVLTKDQLRLAILIGAKEQGIIPDEEVAPFLNSPSQIIFEKAENGAVLVLADTDISVEQFMAVETPRPEDLKYELSLVMENPPGLNTIKSWSAEKRIEAWEWSREREGDDPRPEFIKERKHRENKVTVKDFAETPEDINVDKKPVAESDPVAQYFADT